MWLCLCTLTCLWTQKHCMRNEGGGIHGLSYFFLDECGMNRRLQTTSSTHVERTGRRYGGAINLRRSSSQKKKGVFAILWTQLPPEKLKK